MQSFGPKRVFVKHTISSRLKCPICFDIFDKPRRLFCGHTFCKKCIRQFLKPHKNPQHVHTCPICRDPIDINNIGCDLVAKKIIDELKVSCPVNGCPWKGESQLLQTHYNYGCSMKSYINNLPKHKSISLIQEEEEDREAQLAEKINQNTQRAPLLSRVVAKNPNLVNFNREKPYEEDIIITEKTYEPCVKILVTRATQTIKKDPFHYAYAVRHPRPPKIIVPLAQKKKRLFNSMLNSSVNSHSNRFEQSSSYQEQTAAVPIINLQNTKAITKVTKYFPQ